MSMAKITWGQLCLVCQRPINRGKPIILFGTDKPTLAGISHYSCSEKVQDHAHFRMCPPFPLSSEQVSVLVQFYPRLYSLPRGEEPNHELRAYMDRLLQDYPTSLTNPIESLREFIVAQKRLSPKWMYSGNLETDFLRLFGEIQKAARAEPFASDIDFRA